MPSMAGWSQRGHKLGATSANGGSFIALDLSNYRNHHRAAPSLLVDGPRDRVVNGLVEGVHVRVSVRKLSEAVQDRSPRIRHEFGGKLGLDDPSRDEVGAGADRRSITIENQRNDQDPVLG